MGFLIVGSVVPPSWEIQTIGEGLLWLAAALTLLTGYDYLRVGLKHMAEDDRADKKS
jgi:cardiolipin synthase